MLQTWAQDTGEELSHVYATMNSSPSLRENLMIPSKLWAKLAPDIKKAIVETRKTIQSPGDKSSKKTTASLPKQYPTAQESIKDHQTFLLHRHDQLKSCDLLYESSDNSSIELAETDDDRSISMARSVLVPDEHLLKCMVLSSTISNSSIVYADGGADTCIGGSGWKPIHYTVQPKTQLGYLYPHH